MIGCGDPPPRPLALAGAVEFASLEWVDWFNSRRLLEAIGNIPPAQGEANYYAAVTNQAMAAWLIPTCLRKSRRGRASATLRVRVRRDFS